MKKCLNIGCNNSNKDKNGMLSEGEFGINNCKKDGFNIYCKYCCRKIVWEKRHPEEGSYENYVLKAENAKNVCVKICHECEVEKCVSEFYKCYDNRDELQTKCKECVKKYYINNKEKLKKYRKQYRDINKDILKKKNKEYYEKHKKQKSDYLKRYYEKNKERVLIVNNIYRENHKEELREYFKKYNKDRRKFDIGFKLRENVARAINGFLTKNGNKKTGSILKFLPYTLKQLEERLESQFEYWMCWENHGKYNPNVKTWQIDHIIPHSSFHYETMDCEEFRKCWALENLRPLETIKNMKKGNRIG